MLLGALFTCGKGLYKILRIIKPFTGCAAVAAAFPVCTQADQKSSTHINLSTNGIDIEAHCSVTSLNPSIAISGELWD